MITYFVVVFLISKDEFRFKITIG